MGEKDESIAFDVLDERDRQDRKWGVPKDLPDGTGLEVRVLADLAWAGHSEPAAWPLATMSAAELATAAKAACDTGVHQGTVTFAAVLLEEVFEALAESDPGLLRAELVQVAAVAQKWIRVIDERSS